MNEFFLEKKDAGDGGYKDRASTVLSTRRKYMRLAIVIRSERRKKNE